MRIDDVLGYWFDTLAPEQWWQADPALDADIARRFGELHERAVQAELFAWRESPRGRLAEVIVLDQFSRNIHRGDARAFAADGMALVLAQAAVAVGADAALTPLQRSVLYLPYMHSESAAIHVVAERLYRELGRAQNLDYERRHKAIIDRFGRYPHRNAVLGRASTAEEVAFLQQPGSSF